MGKIGKTNGKIPRPCSLTLYFSNLLEARLEKTVFKHPEAEHPLVCMRGNFSSSGEIKGSFRWTPAVQALSYFFCKSMVVYKLNSREYPFEMLGGAGSPAASLDYAISKQPNWMLDMFGVDYDGNAVIKKLILRSNSERKRPGPVVLRLSQRNLPLTAIDFYVDDKNERDPIGLFKLMRSLEEIWAPPFRYSEEYKKQILEAAKAFTIYPAR